MRTGTVKGLWAAAALAAAAGLAGCGEQCKTEPVAKVDEAQSCTAAPGTPVTIGVRLCPTCNQTGASCQVDVQGDIIQLDTIVEACEDVTSCPSSAPTCEVAPLPCSFTAPATPGVYNVAVYDAATNSFPTIATLTVEAGAAASCAFASALR